MATRILIEIEDDGPVSIRCDALDVAVEGVDCKTAAEGAGKIAEQQIERLAAVEEDLRAASKARLVKWRVLAEIMERLV